MEQLKNLETKLYGTSRQKRGNDDVNNDDVRNDDVRTSQIVLPPALRKEVQDYISRTHFSFVKFISHSVRMPCKNGAANAVIEEFPMASFLVLHNNGPLEFDQSRMSFTQGVLSVMDLNFPMAGYIYVS